MKECEPEDANHEQEIIGCPAVVDGRFWTGFLLGI
jgi:hypothetical protein